ncbi:CDF family Co(II)/Ni(II) efflux transporter DmeF [Hyphomicrobium sp.]|uniref:CDF family Co(II)/Ni(II) efflux transporter DmeF n=1 Tax=Hyphomicrobium sp. TaxID=82 RepID=UPI0025C0EE43|nr:CDF family Co(II)/Ni(II) efflux transporter DmeF [Hyphomicrobium sp.]MCC7250313.1 CDF family Co(II)/Ni(II) efflux transporter DmeF [Hyphomicrobium sp.]
MHTHSLDTWRHSHFFLGAHHQDNERRVWLVVALTTVTMVAEIVGGTIFGSVALTADGWHMATHAAALSISGLAYAFARRQAHNPRYTFGTGKFGELAGYTSAILLGVISIGIVYQAAERFIEPVQIHYTEAMVVAVLGLLVNLVSAWLLSDHDHGHNHHHDHHHHYHDGPDMHDHGHHHAHAHGHGHAHGRHADGNRRAAFAHVVADALTSALAILALIAASMFGWTWIDPLVGVVGAVLIAIWALNIMRTTSAVLLDTLPSEETAASVRAALEIGDDRVTDLHLWQLGPGHMGAIVSIVTHDPRPPEHYKAKLSAIPHLSHTTVEVLHCA